MSTMGPQSIIITKVEMIRFSLFMLSTMIAILMQMEMSNQFVMNDSLKKTLFSNVSNIFNDVPTRYSILKWADTELYRLYNLNNFENDILPKIIPISNLTLQTEYTKIDSMVNVWDKSGQDDIRVQGIFQQYEYPFIQEFQPYQVFIRRKTQADPIRDINQNSLRLFDLGYVYNIQYSQFTKQIKGLKVSAAYYSPDMQMISIFRMEFVFKSAGKAYQLMNVHSFKTNYYNKSIDLTRTIFEILFALIYINYLYMEGYKIYFKIQQALKDDQIAQEALKKKEQRQKGMQKNTKKQQVLGIDDQIEYFKPDGEEEKDKKIDPILQAQKQLEEAQRKTKIIVNTVVNHIKDIWSALDVMILVLLGISASKYMSAAFAPTYSDDLNYNLSNSESFQQIFSHKRIIDQIATQADNLNAYRRLISVALLIMWVKILKYIIYSFNRLIQYLDIILNVVEYMVFYLVLLSAVLMSFALFIYFMYGSAVYEASTILSALVYVIGFMFGSNDRFENLYQYDTIITFLLCLLFYLIVIIILLNMFFVFVKAEYNTYQNNLELQQEKAQKNGKHDEIAKYLHPFWQIYNLIEYFLVRFWFTFTMKRDKFDEYMDNKDRVHSVYEREFKENPQLIDFNVDFANLMNQTVDEDEKKQNQTKFLTQEEKERQNNLQKMELVKLIWKTVLLIMILSLNFILVQQFYSPSEAFLQTDSLQRKIKYGSTPAFNDIDTKTQMLSWLQNQFSDLFDDNLFGRREIKQYSGEESETYDIDSTLPTSKQIEQYQLKEYSFNNLKRGYSLNTFNIVVNNLMRATLRRSNQVVNPDARFLTISPHITELFLENPLDQQASKYENKTDFSASNQAIGNVTIPYSSTIGYQSTGGLILIMEPKQLSGLANTFNSINLFEDMVSLVIEFVTFNPGNKRGWAHTKVWFTINQCGVILKKQIDVSPIKKNSLQTLSEISILILSVSLIIALTYYIYITVKTMLHKNFSYNRWYNTYVLLAMNKSQLYMRERHMPEFIRQSLYLMDISQFLNLLFLVLMGAQITLILIYFIQINGLVRASQIFEQPINTVLKSTIFSGNEVLSPVDFLKTIDSISSTQGMIGIFGSLSILVLCLEILYLVSHNKDFQMLTNSIKYTLSHLPFILIVLYGFIITFTTMGHLLLGTQEEQFSTFYGSLVQFTDYILKIPNMALYREEDKALEFFLMIFPYILMVRFIIMNIFFSIALRGYLLSRKAADSENSNTTLSIKPFEFVLLSYQMFTFKEKLAKIGSDQYLMQLIKQFEPTRVFSQMKENIRNQTNLTSMKAWAEECAKEIKDEKEIRQPLDVACNEILQSYIDMNNKGLFSILAQLDDDLKRKSIEFSLKLTYISYFKNSIDQLDKFNLFFNRKKEQFKEILFAEERSEDHDKLVYISSLESQLEENIQSMTFIRQELLQIGYDIDMNGQVDTKDKIEQVKQIKKKMMFQNPLASAVQSVMHRDPQDVSFDGGQQQQQQEQEQKAKPQKTIFQKKIASLVGK